MATLLTDNTLTVPLTLSRGADRAAAVPVTAGLPFPRGSLREPAAAALVRGDERVAVQTQALARWPDGSVKWLLADAVLPGTAAPQGEWSLDFGAETVTTPVVTVRGAGRAAVVDTGAAEFRLDLRSALAVHGVRCCGSDALAGALKLVLKDARGRAVSPRVESAEWEATGPVRATLRVGGRFGGAAPCRFVARLCFFAGTGLVRLRLTLHNPRRARHRGGLWDLGDPGSILLRELAVEVGLASPGCGEVNWSAEPGQPPSRAAGPLEIYQDSSGGPNWDGPNHVDRTGSVPCQFRGYRVRRPGQEVVGLRANPVVTVRGAGGAASVAVPQFWQQFPKAIEADGGLLRVGLFPRQSLRAHELQGGEQKTHTVWLNFAAAEGPAADLDWVHTPTLVRPSPEWYAASGALPHLLPADPDSRLDSYLSETLEGENHLLARREVIDEYGWRHFGEVYADHEAEHYDGPPPHVSHYNNQYDFLAGAIVQHLRTGDGRWFDVFDPLARHAIDVDIYHTDRDRAAYNGGLFWFTDHYKTAATCTHRTYSRANRAAGQDYGGGPSSNHNFTTGLLLYHCLTGDPEARAAVLSLADWVVNMDDGRKNLLGLIDAGPTGLASCTGTEDYHGPGRGAGNSVNALLDAWLLTGTRAYLDKAEELIRRCVHPADDVAGRDLLDVEKRWSYTVFLVALDRYLCHKAEAGELDGLYAYARASLLRYAAWMADNEVPYYDHPEKLEYPTEAWAGQEFRKANVLRLASAHADEPLRSRLLRRGRELADRAWSDLLRFDSRASARGLALMMSEGPLDAWARVTEPEAAPRPDCEPDYGVPETFVPQKQRVRAQFRTARGLLRASLRLVNPWNWACFLAARV